MLNGLSFNIYKTPDDLRHLLDNADEADAISNEGLKELCDWLDSNHVRYSCKRFGWKTRVYVSSKNTKNIDISVFEKAKMIADETNRKRVKFICG